MRTVTLSSAVFEWSEFIPANTTTITDVDMFVDLSNAIIERFVLQDPNRFDTMINSLHSNEFELKISMPVTVELIDDDEAVAAFPEGNIAICGDSPAHAVEELRHHLIGLYTVFKREQDNLGSIPKAQLKQLEAYIGETGRK